MNKLLENSSPSRRKFIPPDFFLKWVIDEFGETGLIERFSAKERDAKRALELSVLNADDLAIYKELLANFEGERESLLAEFRKLVMAGLQHKKVIAKGYPSLVSPRAYIPPRLWHFLNLDFGAAVASGGGLEFHGIVLADWGYFDGAERAEALAGINETERWIAEKEWAARKPTEPPPGSDPDHPFNVAVVNNPGFIDSIRRGEAVMAGARMGGQRSTGNERKVSDAEKEKWREMAREIWERRDDWFQTDVAREIQKHFPDRSYHTIKKEIAILDPRTNRPRGRRAS